jgi:SAM-dependent methyltransferase
MTTPWYIDLFNEDYLRYFTTGLTPELTAKEVDFIIETLGLPRRGQILDLCCGHGRHTIELARRGYRTTGLDLSVPFLKKADIDAREAKANVRWVHADMRQIPFEQEFDACMNWYTAFGYFDSHEDNQQVIESIHRALKPGGKLLIDTINHAWLMRNYAPHGWQTTPDGAFLLEERRFDWLAGRNIVNYTLITPDGQRKTGGHSLRVYTLAEMAVMIAQAGLTIREVFGDIDGSFYGLTSRHMIILAEKG